MTTVSPEVIEYHELGRKLTKQEVSDFIDLSSGSRRCSECGEFWSEHRIRCSSSADNFNQPTQG